MTTLETRFPFFCWIKSKLTGRWACRICIAIPVLFLCLTTAARLRSYLMARKIQAVLHGLAEMRVDQTSEGQLVKTVPYLTRNEHDWKVGGIVHRVYQTEISNEPDGPISWSIMFGSGQVAYWLGYRYISFEAGVLVKDGRVSQVRYGLAKEWVRPRELGYIVSAKSVHGFWLPRQHSFEVTSEDDESPQYRPWGDKKGIHVIYTNDASPESTKRAFQLNLSCFWSLLGCNDARKIAPALWQDVQVVEVGTLYRLRAGKCPDYVVEGRMRYLPDVTLSLLEVTGSRRAEVSEEGDKTEDWFTDYRLKEVIRGDSTGSWNNIRFRRVIPSTLDDPGHTIANQSYPPTEIGSQVLFFGNLHFDSCRIIPATRSALEIVRNVPVPPKRPEDEIPTGLQ